MPTDMEEVIEVHGFYMPKICTAAAVASAKKIQVKEKEKEKKRQRIHLLENMFVEALTGWSLFEIKMQISLE